MNDLRRDASFESYEPSEFIGAWSPRTDSFATRLPMQPRVARSPRLSALADAVLALSAVAAIFSIPLLIMFVTLR